MKNHHLNKNKIKKLLAKVIKNSILISFTLYTFLANSRTILTNTKKFMNFQFILISINNKKILKNIH